MIGSVIGYFWTSRIIGTISIMKEESNPHTFVSHEKPIAGPMHMWLWHIEMHGMIIRCEFH
jgi:hypothetical protein